MSYEQVFKTNEYHIINEKGDNKDKFRILPNSHDYSSILFPVDRHPPSFRGYKERVHDSELTNSPNENRFESIDKNPNISTRTKHSPSFRFDGQSSRSDASSNPFQNDYEKANN